MSADSLFERVGRKIADGEEDRVVGAIPSVVERAQGIRVCGGNHGFIADRIATRAKVRRVDEVLAGEGNASLPVIAGATLAFDDAAFAFERGEVEGLLAGEFAQRGKRLVEAFAAAGERDIDLIDGMRGKRERGGVGPEGDPMTLQRIDHRVTRKATRAGESHVFDEMREAALVFLLVQRTGEDDQPEGDMVARFGVGEDDKTKTVGKSAEAGVGVRRQVARFMRPRGGPERCKRKQSEDDKPAAEVDHRG